MFHGGGGGPVALIFGILSSALSLIAAAVAFAVVLGVLVLLVRFLWFGTRAAQLYLKNNGDSDRFTWPVRRVGDPAPSHPTAPTAPTAPPVPAGDDPTVPLHTPEDPSGEPSAPRAPLKPRSAPPAE